MNKCKVVVLALLAVSVVFSACTKKDPETGGPDPTGINTVKLEFSNKAGSSALSLNNQWYKNEHGDSFTVSKFNYYISNVKLNGSSRTYTEENSYHLVSQDVDTSHSFDLVGVGYGGYSSITFTIGVDSARNEAGAQTGALDPANGMFWTWSTGYIMVMMEGNSPSSPEPGNKIIYHAGGYKGENATQRTVTLPLTSTMVVAEVGVNHVHIEADILKLFKSPTAFDFATTYTVNTMGVNAKKYADNYANMFSVTYAGL